MTIVRKETLTAQGKLGQYNMTTYHETCLIMIKCVVCCVSVLRIPKYIWGKTKLRVFY